MKELFTSNMQLVGKVMDMRLERQNVVMSNLANIKTPGYKARRLEFEKELQASLGLDARGKLTRTDEKHIPVAFDPAGFSGNWYKAFQPHFVHGQDSVDLDKEMATMAKNNMMYNALTTVLKKDFESMRAIISEGQK